MKKITPFSAILLGFLWFGCSRNVYEIPHSVQATIGPHFEAHKDSLTDQLVYGEMYSPSWLIFELYLCNVKKAHDPELYKLVRYSGRKLRINGKLYPLVTNEDLMFSTLNLENGSVRDFSQVVVSFGEMKMIEWSGDSVLSFWVPQP